VPIYERQGVVPHAKTAVIDGQWSVVGLANLAGRSVVFNNEIDAVILGREFGAGMGAQFRRDIAASKEISLSEWRNRGIGERLQAWKSSLVEALL
jgi:cardiolipin synthase